MTTTRMTMMPSPWYRALGAEDVSNKNNGKDPIKKIRRSDKEGSCGCRAWESHPTVSCLRWRLMVGSPWDHDAPARPQICALRPRCGAKGTADNKNKYKNIYVYSWPVIHLRKGGAVRSWGANSNTGGPLGPRTRRAL